MRNAPPSSLFAASGVLLALILGGTLLFLYPSTWSIYQHDLPIFLDALRRLESGQLPHRDFFSPLGSFTFVLQHLAYDPSHPATMFVSANMMVATVLSFLILLALPRRFGAALAFLVSLLLVMAVVSPRPLDAPANTFSWAMIYNRYGEALSGALLILLLLPPKSEDRSCYPSLEAVLIGAVLAILLFIKITYFMVAGLAIGLGLLLGTVPIRRLIPLLLGAIFTAPIYLLVTGIDWQLALRDLLISAQAQSGYTRYLRLSVIIADNQLMLLPPYLLLIADRFPPKRSQSRHWLPILLFSQVASLFLCVTNAQSGDLFWAGLGSLISVELVGRAFRSLPTHLTRQMYLILLAASLSSALLPLSIVTKDMLSIGYAHGFIKEPGDLPESFPSPTGGSSIFEDFRVKGAPHFVRYVNDGIQLLEATLPHSRHVHHPTVMNFDFSNPFPAGLNLPNARGDAPWWHIHVNFSETAFPAPERVFAEVNFVLVPKKPEMPSTTQAMLQIYGPHLRSQFQIVAKSDLWSLYERR